MEFASITPEVLHGGKKNPYPDILPFSDPTSDKIAFVQ